MVSDDEDSLSLELCEFFDCEDDFEFFVDDLWRAPKEGRPRAAYGSVGPPSPGKFNPEACRRAR